MSHLLLVHNSGHSLLINVAPGSVEVRRDQLNPNGFNLGYTSDDTTIHYLRTEAFDAVIEQDTP